MNSTLSSFNTMTEVPLSKAPNPQLLPGRWSNGCPLLRWVQCVCSLLLTAVCVHLDGLNAEHQFRVWVTILDNTSHYFFIIIIIILKNVGNQLTVAIDFHSIFVHTKKKIFIYLRKMGRGEGWRASLYEFITFAKHKRRYFEECWMAAIDFHSIFFHTNGYRQLFGYQDSSKYLLLCSAENRNSCRIGTTWETVDDRIVILAWTVPLSGWYSPRMTPQHSTA